MGALQSKCGPLGATLATARLFFPSFLHVARIFEKEGRFTAETHFFYAVALRALMGVVRNVPLPRILRRTLTSGAG